MIVEKIETRPTWDGGAEIVLKTADRRAVQALQDKYVDGKKYVANIKQYRAKRSLDANSYYWVLVSKMAEVLSTSKVEVHNQQLSKYGALKTDKDGKLIFSLERDNDNYLQYEKRHLYPTDKTEERKGILYRWFVEIKGSSEYNTKEMSVLIDGTVQDAKEIDIETLPPDEIERMKQQWATG